MIYTKDYILQIEMSAELKKWTKSYIGRSLNKNAHYFDDCADDAAVVAKLESIKKEKEFEKQLKADKEKNKTRTIGIESTADAVNKCRAKKAAQTSAQSGDDAHTTAVKSQVDKLLKTVKSYGLTGKEIIASVYNAAARLNREQYKQFKIDNNIDELTAQIDEYDEQIEALEASIREQVTALTEKRNALFAERAKQYHQQQQIFENWQDIIRYCDRDLFTQLQTESDEFDATLKEQQTAEQYRAAM